jgi:hypothetical protein
VVLYGCEILSPTLREGHRLRVFENKVLRRIYEPKMNGVIGGWRKLHNEGLHNLYSSESIIRIMKSRSMRLAGHVARIGQKRNAYRIFVGKLEVKRQLRRPRRRCVDNVKMDLREIGWGVMDWINLVQDWDQWRALAHVVIEFGFHKIFENS